MRVCHAQSWVLPAPGPGGMINVIIEASRSMTAKRKYDSDSDVFVFGRSLPEQD
jgi:hypothetical protein